MDAFEPKPPHSTPPMEVDEVRSLAAELAIQRVSHCSLTLRRGGPAAPRSGCSRAVVTGQFRLTSCSTSAASRFSMAVTAPARSLWFCS